MGTHSLFSVSCLPGAREGHALSSPPGQDPSSEIWAPGSLGLPLFAIVLVYAGRVTECPAATEPHRLTLGPDWTSRSITEYSAQAAGFCGWTCFPFPLTHPSVFFSSAGPKGITRRESKSRGPRLLLFGNGFLASYSPVIAVQAGGWVELPCCSQAS